MELTEVDGRPAVLMEYLEGCDVNALLAGGPVPPRVAPAPALAPAPLERRTVVVAAMAAEAAAAAQECSAH